MLVGGWIHRSMAFHVAGPASDDARPQRRALEPRAPWAATAATFAHQVAHAQLFSLEPARFCSLVLEPPIFPAPILSRAHVGTGWLRGCWQGPPPLPNLSSTVPHWALWHFDRLLSDTGRDDLLTQRQHSSIT